MCIAVSYRRLNEQRLVGARTSTWRQPAGREEEDELHQLREVSRGVERAKEKELEVSR